MRWRKLSSAASKQLGPTDGPQRSLAPSPTVPSPCMHACGGKEGPAADPRALSGFEASAPPLRAAASTSPMPAASAAASTGGRMAPRPRRRRAVGTASVVHADVRTARSAP
eukprot:6189602-Pleurochrysis_carterae.AAC.3